MPPNSNSDICICLSDDSDHSQWWNLLYLYTLYIYAELIRFIWINHDVVDLTDKHCRKKDSKVDLRDYKKYMIAQYCYHHEQSYLD